jgi:hypothetical protein
MTDHPITTSRLPKRNSTSPGSDCSPVPTISNGLQYGGRTAPDGEHEMQAGGTMGVFLKDSISGG